MLCILVRKRNTASCPFIHSMVYMFKKKTQCQNIFNEIVRRLRRQGKVVIDLIYIYIYYIKM